MKRLLSLLLIVSLLLTAVPALADWTCTCGASNAGRFCTDCGTAQPADDTWTCACGKQNTSRFCSSCGRAKDAANTCAACGYKPEDGGAFRFCPSCGTAFGEGGGSGESGGGAVVPTGPLEVTSVTENGDGTATVAWTGGAAPYTVYCVNYSGGASQIIASDTWETSVTTRVMEPHGAYRVWVEGGGTAKKFAYLPQGEWVAYHNATGQFLLPLGLTLKVNHAGQTETVDSFSRAEIEAAKASGSDWTHDYVADVHLSYTYDADRYINLQVYVDDPTGAGVYGGSAENLLIPAGKGCTLWDAVQLYNAFAVEEIQVGTYSVSLYDGANYITSLTFTVTE